MRQQLWRGMPTFQASHVTCEHSRYTAPFLSLFLGAIKRTQSSFKFLGPPHEITISMRLLNVHSGRLEEFFGRHIPEYAILSHTWGATEIVFSDIQAEIPATPTFPSPPALVSPPAIEPQVQWSPSRPNPPTRSVFSNSPAQAPSPPVPSISSKIRFARNQAIADRLNYVWVDTCCTI
jgi:hypothetical protein